MQVGFHGKNELELQVMERTGTFIERQRFKNRAGEAAWPGMV
jgi:hypothetical protein